MYPPIPTHVHTPIHPTIPTDIHAHSHTHSYTRSYTHSHTHSYTQSHTHSTISSSVHQAERPQSSLGAVRGRSGVLLREPSGRLGWSDPSPPLFTWRPVQPPELLPAWLAIVSDKAYCHRPLQTHTVVSQQDRWMDG